MIKEPFTKPSRRVMGVDPGTSVTGFGLIAVIDGRLEPLDFGVIRPPAKLKLSDRYLVIHDGIDHLLEKHRPDVVVIETQFVHKNPDSAIKLGMARGVILIAAKKRGIAVYEYAPRKAKLAVTGTGSASKPRVQKMVQYQLKLAALPTPEDAADALALAICHAHAEQFNRAMGIEL